MSKEDAGSTIPTFQFDESEIEQLKQALLHHGAYLKATQRDLRPYDRLAERLTNSHA